MSHEHEESDLVQQARRAFAACQAEVYDMETAQAEEVIEVTVRSRYSVVTTTISPNVSLRLTTMLLEHMEERRRRLWQVYLSKLDMQGLDAQIDLRNIFKK